MAGKNGLWIDERTFRSFSEIKRANIGEEFATRQKTMDISAMFGYLPNPDPVLKKMGKDISVYRDLLSDPHLGSCVESRKAGLLSMEWMIDRGDSQARHAAFFTDLFNDLDVDGIITEILDAPLFGYQFLEIIWGKAGDYIVPVEVKGKPQEWFVFDDNNLPKMRTRSNRSGVALPERKFLLATHQATYMNPYGFPLLSRCFWPIAFKKGGLKFWAVFTEKYGMPWIIGKHPRGIERPEVAALADSLEAMIQDAVSAIPDDSSVEILESSSKGASADIYKGLAEFSNSEISKAMLGQTLTTEVGDKGSYAASKTHSGIRDDIIDADRKIGARIMNMLTQWTFDINFGSGSRPKFLFYEEEEVDQALATRDKTLADTGQIRFTKKYFVTNYGFAEDDIEMDGGSQPKPEEFAASDGNTDSGIETERQAREDVDGLIDGLPDTALQAQMEETLKPLIDMINGAKDYNEILSKLAGLYTDMNTDQLEKLLERLIFLTDVWGRVEK